ncbi:hypothetical protein OPV22_024527 [Ensete ventricosum]|uniref:YTH domain-containing family protein n=1 Tax=Ensete ventricosum TaxID=4639 RepID=A0AAV8QA95_ENSVE|nr:hypothetical protein OPV22_024527 [Ensete ventricosum]
MAAVAPAPPADSATDLMQKLSLDPKDQSNDASDVIKKPSGVQYDSANGGELPMALIPTGERSLTPLLQEHMDASMSYIPNGYAASFYYGGYDGSMTEWEDYPRYVTPNGVEVPPLGVYGDMYHHGYGYAPFSQYPSPGSTVPTLAHNSQLYGPQHYQYTATYYQPPIPTGAPYKPNQTSSSEREVSTSAAADLPPIPVDTTKSNSNGTAKGSTNGNNESAKTNPGQQNLLLNPGVSFGKGALSGGLPPSGYQDPRFGFDGAWSSVPWFDGTLYPDGQQRPATGNAVSSMTSHNHNTMSTRNQNFRPLPHLMGMHSPRPAGPGIANKITLHGNKKLDAAYLESKEKTSGCPVFLFFSVNTSGQFVGVAEMHIKLENNDNKPVTNSRDTQEVKLEQGLQLLKLVKEHVRKTSILEDFSFYETRQKVMQEKRTKQQQFQKKVMYFDEKDEDGADGKPALQNPVEVVTVTKKEPAQGGLALAQDVTNGVATVADVAPPTDATENRGVVVNDVANCC